VNDFEMPSVLPACYRVSTDIIMLKELSSNQVASAHRVTKPGRSHGGVPISGSNAEPAEQGPTVLGSEDRQWTAGSQHRLCQLQN